ncbi:PilZ domain-containing protein [Pseudobdellovibrio exovorus]|uniref:PilZ domain-containing protein n=1 Tax=Pseudobdellovibrio exovorus JSS TaxID=1184267 RepID=M4V9I6_9BACT|nr:PilZ domain-containing protein [Pseudobdellovibrio exovorus]AGH94691.1 hypothetical protein A11Q_471 [Pseudobdellovibrio exovorus JSS]
MRKFKRVDLHSPCVLLLNGKAVKSLMLNFSRMGAGISTDFALPQKKYVSLVYKNEKDESIRMLAYVTHSSFIDGKYISGLQFVGIEGRSAS